MERNVFKDMISESSQFDREKVYWLGKLSGDLTKSYFPYDYIRSGIPGFNRGAVDFKVQGDLFSKLEHLTNRSDNNLFVVLSVCLNILLSKYSGHEDIVIGMPILKQEMEGDFLNVLLTQRNRVNPGMKLKEFLLQVKQTINEADDHSNYPIERLEYHLGLENVEKGSALFETVIVLDNIHERGHIEKMNHNIVFRFNRTERYIAVKLEYNARLYRRETVERTVKHLSNALGNMIANLNASINDIDILSEDERERLLGEFNDTGAEYPSDTLFHELFEDMAAKNPGKEAVIAMGGDPVSMESSTYGRLNERANRLARCLVEKGVGPDTITAVMTGPSLDMVTCILAVLKAGGAFLPMDPGSPVDRTGYLLRESNCPVLLTQEHFLERVQFAGETINISDKSLYSGDPSNLRRRSLPGDLFYTIYTSGTTGKPKGVLLTHRNLVNYITWFSKAARLTADDKTMLASSYAFDLGYSIVLGSLSTGGELHLIPREWYMDAEKLTGYIKEKAITYLKMTPSLFSVIVNGPGFSSGVFSTLRLVVLGGEEINTLDVEKAHRVCGHIKIMNHYGPTEATIGAVARYIDFDYFEDYKKNPTIGKPAHNTRIYILAKDLKLMPDGVPGELFIGGDSVARGYLNHPELTAEKFASGGPLFEKSGAKTFPEGPSGLNKSFLGVQGAIFQKSPLVAEGMTIYKTGDLARWMDGNIEYLGRIDTQVKIRGYRVELGEIESQILKSPVVKDVVVQAIEDKSAGKFLCAYIVPAAGEETVESGELKAYLSENLPDYMIPSHFVCIAEIPLTRNGKLDRQALSRIEITLSGSDYTPPENEDQAKMVDIWSGILGGEKEKIGIYDNFFELGGHSLNVMFLVSKIQEVFDVKISLIEVFGYPTPAGLVEHIMESGAGSPYGDVRLEEAKDYYPLSSPQRRFYLAQQLNRENTAYNIPGVLKLSPGFGDEKLEHIFKGLIRRQESLRTSFKIVNDVPVQIIHDSVDFKIDYQDGRGQDTTELIANFIKPFDLSAPPLFAVRVITTDREKILVMNIHHIISDGLSIRVLAREFNALAGDMELGPLRLRYKDYASRQNRWLENKSDKKMEKYWLDTLEGFKITGLTEDNPGRKGVPRGNYERAIIDADTYLKIDEFCSRKKITRFSFMVTLFLLILAKETGQNDITLGIPVDSREHIDTQDIVGVFLNVFLLRAVIEEGDTIGGIISKINDNFIGALGNSAYPYEELYYRLREHYRLPGDELFTILFNYLPGEEAVGAGDKEREIASVIPFEITPKYPVTIYIKEIADKMDLQFLYRGDLFSKGRIERVVHNYLKFIEIALTREDTVFSEEAYKDMEKGDAPEEFAGEFDNEDLF